MKKNLVELNRFQLNQNNYVRKGYWFDFSQMKMEEIRRRRNDDFYIIIYGDSDNIHDYYVIPYEKVSMYFTEKTLARDRRNHRRWIGSIHKDHMFTIKAEPRLNIVSYYGKSDLLDKALV